MTPINRKTFGLLLVWRAAIVLIALYTILEKALEHVVLPLLTLWILLVFGEFLYKLSVHQEQRREHERKEKAWREQRAEEARQRFEEEQAKEAAKPKPRLMSLGDEEAETASAQSVSPLGTMSEKDFDLALIQPNRPS